jgi:hypothetical protein
MVNRLSHMSNPLPLGDSCIPRRIRRKAAQILRTNQGRKTWKVLMGLGAALASTSAYADPYSIVYFIASWAASYGYYYVAAALVIAATYSSYSENRRRSRHARQDAINQYNASLKDVGTIQVAADPDIREIYGEREVGGYIVAAFTQNKTGLREDGTTYTRPDAIRWVVVSIGKGPIQAITDVKIAGKTIGTLDSNGFVTGGDYYRSITQRAIATATSGTSVIVPQAPITVTRTYLPPDTPVDDPTHVDDAVTVTNLGNGTSRIDVPITGLVIEYSYSVTTPILRVKTYLGTDTQTADADLIAASSGKWTTNHRGLGWAYAIIMLDLEHEPFQQGFPQFTFVCQGRKVYDVRKDSTNGGSGSHRYNDSTTWEYSRNAGLITSNYMFSPSGLAVNPATGIDWPSVITCANDCDIATFTTSSAAPGIPVGPYAKYTVDGVISSQDSPESVLADLGEAMGGFVSYGSKWGMFAGVWRAPVATLGDDDLDGEISIVQSGANVDEIFNSVHGTFVESGQANPTDLYPYSASTYVTADGGKLWQDITLPYTNYRPRATQIARMLVEKSRLGLVIQFPGKLHLWPRQVGERVYVNSSEYNFVNKPFLIMDWQFGHLSPVTLTLQEDESATYDDLDEYTPVVKNPPIFANPNFVNPLTGFTAVSGSNYTMQLSDGTLVPRVYVTWNTVTDSYAMYGGWVELRWRINDNIQKETMQVPATDAGAWIVGVADGAFIHLEARVWNGYGYSAPVYYTGQVNSRTTAFQSVTGLGFAYVKTDIQINWNAPTTSSWKRTEVRVGASFAAGLTIFNGLATSATWFPNASGTFTFWVKHFDWAENASASAASISVPYSLLPTIADTLLSPSSWVIGSGGSQPGFNQVSPSSGGSNQIVITDGPDGSLVPVWRATSGNAASPGGGEGGWDSDSFPVDPTKIYRFTLWVRRFSSAASGSFYHGVGQPFIGGGLERVKDLPVDGGAINANAYFSNVAASSLPLNRWMLMVGYVFPYTYASDPSGLAGGWDSTTGLRVITGQDFRWAGSYVNSANERNYLFYTLSTPGVQIEFYKPEVRVADGTEQSLAQLIAESVSPRIATAATTAQWNLVTGAPSSTLAAPMVNFGRDAADHAPGKSDIAADAAGASDGLSLRFWDGWTGYLYFTSAYGIAAAQVLGLVRDKVYKVYVRAKKAGSPSSAIVGIWNNTAGTSLYSTDIIGSLTTSWQVIQLPDLVPGWAAADAVYMHFGNTGMSPSGTSADSVWVDWLYFQPVNAAEGATANRYYVQSSAPTGVIDGDVWADTSSSPVVTKLRVSGAWVSAANLSTGQLAQLNSVATAQINANAVTEGTIEDVSTTTGSTTSPGANTILSHFIGSQYSLAAGDEYDISIRGNHHQSFWSSSSTAKYATVEISLWRGATLGAETTELTSIRKSYTVAIVNSTIKDEDFPIELSYLWQPGSAITAYLSLRYTIIFYDQGGNIINCAKDFSASARWDLVKRKR